MAMSAGLAAGLTLALSAAGTVAGFAAQQQQASAQRDYQNAQAKENARANELNNKAAVQEYVEQSAAERIKQMQDQQSTALEEQKIQKEALQKQGTMLASTNASGIALDMLMADYQRQEASEKETVRQQYKNSTLESAINISGYRDRAQNRINSQQTYIAPGVNNPSLAGLAIGLGSAGLNGYNTYELYNRKGQ